jgi:hypothetical protein
MDNREQPRSKAIYWLLQFAWDRVKKHDVLFVAWATSLGTAIVVKYRKLLELWPTLYLGEKILIGFGIALLVLVISFGAGFAITRFVRWWRPSRFDQIADSDAKQMEGLMSRFGENRIQSPSTLESASVVRHAE